MKTTTGTSPNDVGRAMNSGLATLYVLSNAPSGDPLDCVAAAAPLLAPHYAAIHRVGPGAMSVRGLRRSYEPGVDRLLYDFTAPGDHAWAISMLDTASAAVLLGEHSPFAPNAALANLRSAQRYAASGGHFSPATTVGVLDASPPSTGAQSLTRPAVPVAHSSAESGLAMAVSPGAVETAYSALTGLVSQTVGLSILTSSRRDANDLSDIIAAFEMQEALVRYVRNWAVLTETMAKAEGLIDVSVEATPALSEAAFLAGCLGAPVLDLKAPNGAAEATAAFAASKPQRSTSAATAFAATRPLAGFTSELHALIETGFARANQADAAA